MKNLIYISFFSFILSSCIKTKGEITMTYEKAYAKYGNLDSLRSLPLLMEKQAVENPKSFFIGSNFVLVGELNKGVHIFDNIDMQNPQKVGFIRIPNNREFYVKDNYLYAESIYDFIKIDISNIYKPILLSRAENVFCTPLENDKGQQLLGFDYIQATDTYQLNSFEAKEIKKSGKLHIDFNKNVIPVSSIPTSFTGSYGNAKGTLNRIAVEYNHVYVISDRVLHVLNDGSTLAKVNSVNISNNTETIYPHNNRLYLGSESDMSIYNVDNPSSPIKVSTLSHTTSCDPVLPYEDVAYYTLRSVANEGCNEMGENTLNIVTLTNESEPEVISTFTLESPYGMCISNNYLFVGEGINGITIFDATAPRELIKIKQLKYIVAYDVMISPINPNVLITSNTHGIKQFLINWNDFTLSPISQLDYH